MKILIVNSFYYPNVLGGAELSVQHLAEELGRLGHDVVVVCLGREASIQSVNGVKIYYVPLFNIYFPFDSRPNWLRRLVWNLIDIYNPIMAGRLGKILDSEQPDVVHSNILLGFSCSVWKAASKRNIRVVHTLRDHLLLCPRSQMYKNGANCIKQCLSCKVFSVGKKLVNTNVDSVVGISDYILKKHLLFDWFNDASKKIIFNSFSAVDVKSDAGDDSILRFGFVGRITEFKGIELLLQEFMSMAPDANVELIVAGTGEVNYVEKMKAMAKGSSIKFLGFVSRDEFYNQVDVVVVPTLMQEPLGRAVLEAYAFGRPVIASRRGGLQETVEDKKTGLLFDSDLDGDLERCLRAMVDDEQMRKEMAKACVRKFPEFSEKRIAEQYLEVYKDGNEKLAITMKTKSMRT